MTLAHQLDLPGAAPRQRRLPKPKPPAIPPPVREHIRSVSKDEGEILAWIMRLYCPTGFEVDVTYGLGAFYADSRIPKPARCFDLAPRVPGVEQADVRALPLERRSVSSLIFDPPFLHHTGRKSRMGNLYSSYHNQRLLHAMYKDALADIFRVLAPAGVLVFKLQPVIEGGRFVATDCIVWLLALRLGFMDVDRFVLVADRRMTDKRKQQHARRYESYFLVFQKPAGKRGSFAEGLV